MNLVERLGDYAGLSYPFAKTFLFFLGCLLIVGGALLAGYAVKRTDYLYIVLVLLGFIPFFCGLFLFALVFGLLRFSHIAHLASVDDRSKNVRIHAVIIQNPTHMDNDSSFILKWRSIYSKLEK